MRTLAVVTGVLIGAGCRFEPTPLVNTFELVGLHEPLACEDCHAVGEPIVALPTDCASCHLEDAPPDHHEPPCEDCHDEWGWENAVDHSFLPLDLAHDLACESCHVAAPDFSGLVNQCTACHEAERPGPDHFPGQDCDACHSPTAWADAQVDHGFFPLTNAHNVACVTCHVSGSFEGLDTSCASCHEPDRPDPDHHVGRECGVCHSPTAWDDGVDHSFFPLLYGHARECEDCHTAFPDLTGLDGECNHCHEPDRPAADHFAGQDCGTCHTLAGWATGVDHSFFPLQFGHSLACQDCHTAIPDFTGLDGNCSNCHVPDRPDPTHYAAFDCGGCHQITAWTDGLDHSFFPLENAHALECDNCHLAIPDFTGNSSLCASCHEGDRPSPDHFAGTDCSQCHGPGTWGEVASTDHSFFPLQASHAQECDNCHTVAGYTGLTQECTSCHEVHRPGCHFTGEVCGDCHSYLGTWTSTALPIDHEARYVMRVPHHQANLCDECHTTPASQCDFDCLDCHSDASNDHQGVNGYAFTNEACVQCHPDGRN